MVREIAYTPHNLDGNHSAYNKNSHKNSINNDLDQVLINEKSSSDDDELYGTTSWRYVVLILYCLMAAMQSSNFL